MEKHSGARNKNIRHIRQSFMQIAQLNAPNRQLCKMLKHDASNRQQSRIDKPIKA